MREIDSLGGQMGIAADANLLQSRMLNRGKGPAVHSLRAQIDRQHYHIYMKHILEMQENLDVKQSEIVDIITDENNNVSQVVTQLGGIYDVKAVIKFLLVMFHIKAGQMVFTQPKGFHRH